MAKQKSKEKIMPRTVYEVQKEFGLSSGLRSGIIWDSLSVNQADILRRKIETILPKDNTNCNKLFEIRRRNINNKKIEELREELFRNIWMQRKYTNGTLLSAIIYVTVTEERDPEKAKQSQIYSCHPVFRTRRCQNATNSAGCCMVFIDENARVYENWAQYLQNNILPKGTMVAPANGYYTFNDANEIELECCSTPASSTQAIIVNAADAVASIGSSIAQIASLSFPTMGTAVAIGTMSYSGVRKTMKLVDRRQHRQAIGLGNSESRNSWIGLAGDVLNITAMASAQAMKSCSKEKEVPFRAKVAVQCIGLTSLIYNTSCVLNNGYELYLKYKDEEPYTCEDLLGFAQSLIVFTHSINNLAIANEVVAKNGLTMQSVLQTNLRKIYDTVSSENYRLHDQATAILDIIRTVNDIPFRSVLLHLHEINRCLSRGGVLSAISLIGNSVMNMLPGLVVGNLGNEDGNIVTELDFIELAEHYGAKFVEHIINPSSLLDVLNAMGQYFNENVFTYLLELAGRFIDTVTDSIRFDSNTFVSTEVVVYKILMFVVENCTDFNYKYIRSKEKDIQNTVSNYFSSLKSCSSDDNVQRKCEICNGFYYVCTI